MAQCEEQGHGAHTWWWWGVRGALSDLSAIPGGVSGFPSEDIDTTVHPSELEGHSSLPTMSRGTRLSHGDLFDSSWGEEEDGATRRGRLYPKTLPYLCPPMAEVNSGGYEGGDCMDPAEVAASVRRMFPKWALISLTHDHAVKWGET